MDLSPEVIRHTLIYVFVLLISVALHEFGHAFMADRLGDDTPRRQGRVTLNPLAHADPIGTLLLPLVSGLYTGGGGFGWGKPVEWQPHKIGRHVSMSTAKILVAVAGPAMNVVLAVVLTLVQTILQSQQVIAPGGAGFGGILSFAVYLNFVLFFFNLLPVPPLDGGHVAQSFLPYRHRATYESYARYAPFLLLAMMMVPRLTLVFTVPAAFCASHLQHLLGVM